MINDLMGYILPAIVIGAAIWGIFSKFKGNNKQQNNKQQNNTNNEQ